MNTAEKETLDGLFRLTIRYAETLVGITDGTDPERQRTALAFVGFLQNAKNNVMGLEEDITFLIAQQDDGLSEEGVLGKETGRKDSRGKELFIGDTVSIEIAGKRAEMIVIKSNEKSFTPAFKPVKTHGYEEITKTGLLELCSLSAVSCLEQYRASPLFEQDEGQEVEELLCPRL